MNVVKNWQQIWEKRHSLPSGDLAQALIALDGFDSGAGKIEPAAWAGYVDSVVGQLGLDGKHSVFEIGCGAGAFLHGLQQRHGNQTLGGIDFSASLVNIAAEVIPSGTFIHGEAIETPAAPQFDYLISNSVFHYFPNLDYAKSVLRIMASKSIKGLGVFEVPDATTQAAAETARMALLPAGEYEKKYAGLPHLYYPPGWFQETADELGMTCRVFPQQIAGYAQNPYRFNVTMHKKPGDIPR